MHFFLLVARQNGFVDVRIHSAVTVFVLSCITPLDVDTMKKKTEVIELLSHIHLLKPKCLQYTTKTKGIDPAVPQHLEGTALIGLILRLTFQCVQKMYRCTVFSGTIPQKRRMNEWDY